MIPKLSSLSQADKLKLPAELDGWKWIGSPEQIEATKGFTMPDKWVVDSDGELMFSCQAKKYDQSYDAIIPLIQKQNERVRVNMAVSMSIGQNNVSRIFDYFKLTPSQLLDALLIATGKAEV